MTWRDEPLTKGEFVDALTATIEDNVAVKNRLFSQLVWLKNRPDLDQTLQLMFLNDGQVLTHMASIIQAQGEAQDALEDSDAEERRGDGGVPGADGT